ncbi:MAG: hypothetical protein DRQ47_10940 [Gammaproteobacteria bacterium]|nr:MAG: hypothetical protein DRQ47_10940 [Gammaproteobacteria bacterium]
MENQHRKITGYRELNETEIGQINAAKDLGILIAKRIEVMENSNTELDQRWLAIAKTDLQKGLMALTRSIAKPDFF